MAHLPRLSFSDLPVRVRRQLYDAIELERSVQGDGRYLRTGSGLVALGKHAIPQAMKISEPLLANIFMSHPLAALVTAGVVHAAKVLKTETTYPDYSADFADLSMAFEFVANATDLQIESLNIRVAGGLHLFLTNFLIPMFRERIKALNEVISEDEERDLIQSRISVYEKGEAEADHVAGMLKAVRDAGIESREEMLQERTEVLEAAKLSAEKNLQRVETRFKAGLATQSDLDAAKKASAGEYIQNTAESAAIKFEQGSVRSADGAETTKDLAFFYNDMCGHLPASEEVVRDFRVSHDDTYAVKVEDPSVGAILWVATFLFVVVVIIIFSNR